MRYRILIVLGILAFVWNSSLAQIADNDSLVAQRRESAFRVQHGDLAIFDVAYVQKDDWGKLFRIPEHPSFDSLLTDEMESSLLSQINDRRRKLQKDTLLTSDLLYIWEPYFLWLHNEDPHYRVESMVAGDIKVYKKNSQFEKALKTPAFNYICINDTIVVNQSIDPLIEKGDIILSINKIPCNKLLQYSIYKDRYGSPTTLLRNYYYNQGYNKFEIEFIRGGNRLNVVVQGKNANQVNFDLNLKEDYGIKIYREFKTGYIKIQKFYPNNSRLIKIIETALRNFKKQGCVNVIIDLRNNPGGSGHKFNELVSIFTDKPVIPYIKKSTLRVSPLTVGDYTFVDESMMGRNIVLPKEEFVNEFQTIPNKYIGGLNYYVLISKDTSSIAASLANILQYNGCAKLAGESLLRNALCYGEIIDGNEFLPTLLKATSISTTMIDEYTNSIDGILFPDIIIPYIASDYHKYDDPVVTELLHRISN
jgi:hypothetical protein